MTQTVVDPDRALEVRGLITMLEGILSRVVAGFEQAGVSLPERRYWTLSEPAADCPQVVVSFVQAYYGPPGDEASGPVRCDGPRSAAVDIQILREIPTHGVRGRAPTADAIQASSEQLAIDAWLLLDIASELDMWAGPSPVGLGIIATVDAGTAQGGYQGSTLHLTTGMP